VSEITIDHSPVLSDIVIRIPHAEIARLTAAMFEQRVGLPLTVFSPEVIAASVAKRLLERNDDAGFSVIGGLIAELGCDYLNLETDILKQVAAHFAADAAGASNVIPIRADLYDDATTEEFLQAFFDDTCGVTTDVMAVCPAPTEDEAA
jgi:hypothetical protein